MGCRPVWEASPNFWGVSRQPRGGIRRARVVGQKAIECLLGSRGSKFRGSRVEAVLMRLRGPLWSLFGPHLGLFGPSWLGPRGIPLGSLLEAALRPIGGCFGASWGLVWVSWGPLGASWGASWGPLGASWERIRPRARNVRSDPPSGLPLGAVLEASWAVLEASWAVLEPSWAVLGLSWGPLGPSWGDIGGLLGRLGRSQARQGGYAKLIQT